MLNFDNVQEFIVKYDDHSKTRRERRRAGKRDKLDPQMQDVWSHIAIDELVGDEEDA
jgi:hypothetical protein